MDETCQKILSKLATTVVEMDEDGAAAAAQEALDRGIKAHVAIIEGLSKGMEEVGEKYESGEYFIPQLLVCADAMDAGVDVLNPHLEKDFTSQRGRVVIGVVEGDTHDIGKNLVKLMLEAANFEVLDLGRDVPLDQFLDKAKEFDAQLICMSTLMTTTMDGMAKVVEAVREQGLANRFRTMIGGGPVSQSFADKIGADGYAGDAVNAVRMAKQLVAEKV